MNANLQHAAISMRGVTKTFGGSVRAVDGVSLDVATGEVLALLGPSGCGKTTMLRVLAGFEHADRGSVSLRGRAVDAEDVHVPAERRRVGFVFQDYALFPHLTVRENIAFGVGGGAAARRARVRELVELAGLQGLEERYPHELSGGQQQRVAVARALAPGYGLVLLDEPLSNLDPGARGGLRTRLRTLLRRAGTTAIIVTHDRDDAFEIADRVAIMRAGRIEQEGSPRELYEAPASVFVAAFVSDANVLRGTVSGRCARTEAGDVPVPDGWRHGAAVDLVVQPEHLLADACPSGTGVVAARFFRGGREVVQVSLPSGATVLARGDEACVEGAHVRLRLGDARLFAAGDLPGGARAPITARAS